VSKSKTVLGRREGKMLDQPGVLVLIHFLVWVKKFDIRAEGLCPHRTAARNTQNYGNNQQQLIYFPISI
jgi:hypothetical protein